MTDKVVERFDTVGFVMDYEGGELTEDEIIDGFQKLIDLGIVWKSQGHYQRMANALISEGYCTKK